MDVKMPRKKLLVQAIQIALLSLPGYTFATPPDETWSRTSQYLDPGVWTKVVNENDCFRASPRSLLEVQATTVNNQRIYKVSHYYDPELERKLYAKPLSQQIQDHKIVGTEFCKGIVSISDRNLPITKDNVISDTNDGLLLVNVVNHGLYKISETLNQMEMMASQAATGVYSSTQLFEMNLSFQSLLKNVDRTAQTAKFNGIKILDGTHTSIKVPISDGSEGINVFLHNSTTGPTGLNLTGITIYGQSEAQNSMMAIDNAIFAVTTYEADLVATEARLRPIAESEATITSVDVRTDDFIVQHKKPSAITKG